MTSYIGPVTSAVLEGISKEIKKEENKQKILDNIIYPLLCDLSSRYYPYFMMIIMALLLIVILLVAILVINIVKIQKN